MFIPAVDSSLWMNHQGRRLRRRADPSRPRQRTPEPLTYGPTTVTKSLAAWRSESLSSDTAVRCDWSGRAPAIRIGP